MSMNYGSFKWKVNNSKKDLRDYFVKKFGINYSEFNSIEQITDDAQRISSSAKLLIESSYIRKNMTKNEAIQQASWTNIAILSTTWDNPIRNKFDIMKKYSQGITKNNNYSNNISFLRDDICKEIFGDDFKTNYLNEQKNPFNIKYSSGDVLKGLKFPLIDQNISFLLGVMRVDGCIFNSRYQVRLSAKNDDLDFYQNELEQIIHGSFNINAVTKQDSHTKFDINKNKKYQYTNNYINLYSQGLIEFLNDKVRIIDNSEFKNLNIKKLNSVGMLKDSVEKIAKSYFIGMIAGSANVNKSENRLDFTDRSNKYSSELRSICDEYFDLEYKQPKASPYLTYFNKKNIKKMIEDDSINISDEQYGMFVNQKHLKQLYDKELL